MIPKPYNASGAQQFEEFPGPRKGYVTAKDVDTDSARRGCLPRLSRPSESSRRRSSSGNIKDPAYPSKMNPEELDTDIVPVRCFSAVRKRGSSTNRRGMGVLKRMLNRRRRKGTTVATASSGDRSIIGLNVDCGDEHSCISDLDWVHENSSERTMQDSGGIVALAGVWSHDETSETDSIDHAPCRPERQALVGSSHDQESELSRTRPEVSYILALALAFLLLHTKQAQMFWN